MESSLINFYHEYSSVSHLGIDHFFSHCLLYVCGAMDMMIWNIEEKKRNFVLIFHSHLFCADILMRFWMLVGFVHLK